MPSLIESFPVLKRYLNGKCPFDEPLTVGPMNRNATFTIADGIILIGDAAGFLDAITGEKLG
jgi:menaquinone-9 beta-reductase